jgi:hypothetical protein
VIVSGLVPPTAATSYGWIELGPAPSHRIEVSATTLRVVDELGPGFPLLQIPYDPVDHAWLRITASSDETLYEASADGWVWTDLMIVPGIDVLPAFDLSLGLTVENEASSEAHFMVDRVSVCASQ